MDSSANLNNLNIDSFLTTLDSIQSNIKGFVGKDLEIKRIIKATYLLFNINDVTNNTMYCRCNSTFIFF